MTIKVTRPQIDLREEVNKALTTQTLENQDATVKSLVSKGKLDVAGTAKAGQYLLEAIDKNKTDSAVDVFVYDTRKDSDGGAWRNRTQNTSWYNETLNTSTRGARKEFPSVAVIVSDSTASETYIYDGDDPDMPMWMTFDNSAYSILRSHGAAMSLAMLNGKLIVGLAPNDAGVAEIDFLSDSSFRHTTNAGYANKGSYKGNIAERNSGNGFDGFITNAIVNIFVNDVAMTVLPNAPIDSATGLPVPTIALATNGGVNVIHNDGSVISITNTQDSSTFNFCQNVEFRSDGGIVWSADSTGNSAAPRFVHVLRSIPTLNFVHTTVANPSNTDEFYARTTTAADLQFISSSGLQTLKESTGRTNVGTTDGLSSFAYANVATKGLANHINTDYNTGWMPGDIKLATLSDTDDTNAGSELGGLSTFSGTSRLASHTYISGATTISLTEDGNSATTSGYVWLLLNLTAGKQYTVSIQCDTAFTADGDTRLVTMDHPTGVFSGQGTTDLRSLTFGGTSSSTGLILYSSPVSGSTVTYTVSVKEAEEDRSVNNNGVSVFGTVTKTAVATGADLVGYSFGSNSNYLEQAYNSDLDFGTGDFSVMCWVKPDSSMSAYPSIVDRYVSANNESTAWLLKIAEGTSSYYFYSNNTSVFTATGKVKFGVWQQVIAVRRSGVLYFYIDGKLEESGAMDWSITSSGAKLKVSKDATHHLGNSNLALLRVSATAPSAEQIKKMYKDEKLLFTENAKATLYGTSDAVTALAYDDDTELLHVGTSAGRSVFHGLTRIDNTTAAIGAAISASNGMVAED